MLFDDSSDNEDDIRDQFYYGDIAVERQLKEIWRHYIMAQCRGQSLAVDLILQICEQLKEERDEAEENSKQLEIDSLELRVQLDALQDKITTLELKHVERENDVLRLQPTCERIVLV